MRVGSVPSTVRIMWTLRRLAERWFYVGRHCANCGIAVTTRRIAADPTCSVACRDELRRELAW